MDIIRLNLPTLVEKTRNLPVLIVHLLAQRIISPFENELINSKVTQTEQNAKLYDILMSKEDEAFGKLLECLKKSENEQIAEQLEQVERNSKIMNKPIWFDIRPKVSNYTGRESELDELKYSWMTSQKTNILSIHLISGLGGVGKSELCRVLLHDLYEQERVNCMRVNSETDSSLIESVRRLVKYIGMNILDMKGREKNITFIISNVFNFLRSKKAVIVFDNVEEITGVFKIFMEEIEKLESSGPSEIKPFVIITTRFQVLQYKLPRNTKLIELEALTPSGSLSFLTRALEIQGHDQDNDLQTLARKLQYFPLDLTQAVGFIQSKSSETMKLSGRPFDAKEYLELFDKENKEFLDISRISPSRLNRRSAVTYVNWKVAKDRLQELLDIGSVSIIVMSIVSFLSLDGIQVSVLTEITKLFLTTKYELNGSLFRFMRFIWRYLTSAVETVSDDLILGAIRLCSEYSLFSLKKGVIYVHRLVQEVIRIELTNGGNVDREVVSVLASYFGDKLQGKSEAENFIQHAIQLWEHISADTELVEKYKYFPQGVFDKLDRDIKYSQCTSFGSKAIKILTSVVGEDEITLKLMHSKCFVLVKNGKYEEACVGFSEVFKKRKSLLGEEHKDTLASECGIGWVLYYQEKYVEALEVLEKLASAQTRLLGNDHADTLVTKGRIAGVFQRQAKLDEALLIYREINDVTEQVLGMGHRDTLNGKNNIAVVLSCQGKYNEALQIYYEVERMETAVQPAEHPDTLMGKYNIATTLYKMGENSRALSLFREVYDTRKRVLCVDHPGILKCKKWIDKLDADVNKLE